MENFLAPSAFLPTPLCSLLCSHGHNSYPCRSPVMWSLALLRSFITPVTNLHLPLGWSTIVSRDVVMTSHPSVMGTCAEHKVLFQQLAGEHSLSFPFRLTGLKATNCQMRWTSAGPSVCPITWRPSFQMPAAKQFSSWETCYSGIPRNGQQLVRFPSIFFWCIPHEVHV